MSEFERETDVVLSFAYRKQGPGGELPSKAIAYIPAEHADRIMALDARIELLRKYAPLICGGAASLGLICMAAFGWMSSGLAAVFVMACLLQAMARYRKGC